MSTPIASSFHGSHTTTAVGSNQVFGNPPKVYNIADAKARMAGGDDIKRMIITDTAENIMSGFQDLKDWAGDKILKGINVSDGADVALRVADLNGTRAEVSTVLKRLKSATVKVEDTATNIKAGLTDLKLYQRRVDGMAVVTTHNNGTPNDASDDPAEESQLMSFTAADFKANRKLLEKIDNAVVEVELDGDLADHQIKVRAGGKVLVSGDTKFSAQGVNFLKFDNATVLAHSGDRNLDALLELGKQNMWSPRAQAANADFAVQSSLQNAASTDWYEIKPGVFALDETLDADTPIALSYGFHSSDSSVNAGDKNGKFFAPLTEVQKAVVRDAFNYLGGLVNVTFTEDSSVTTTTSFQFGTNEQQSSAGYAYMPVASGATTQIFLANNQSSNDFTGFTDDDADLNNGFQINETDFQSLRSSYGWLTVVHEIGHALGLKHPGNYNAGGGGSSPPYLPKALDNHMWTLMSYNSTPAAASTDPAVSGTTRQNPQTMMVYDIAALQFMYGKSNTSERAQTSVVSALSDNLLADDEIKLRIGSDDYTYTVLAGDTADDVMTELAALVNAGTDVTATVLKSRHGSGDSLREYSYLSLTGKAAGVADGAFVATVTITDGRANSLSGGAISTSTAASATDEQINEMTAVEDAIAGDRLDLTISGVVFSYTVEDGDTSVDIAAGLKSLVNASGTGSATAIVDDSAADGSMLITAKAVNTDLAVSLTLVERAISGGLISTPVDASDARMENFQTLDFSATWNGLQTVWTPTDADGKGATFDASAVTTRTIIDMRPGTFSSVNLYNNIGLSFGSQYSTVLGGTDEDVVFAGLYTASIDGGGGDDAVLLAGTAADWKLGGNAIATDVDGNVTGTLNGSYTRSVNGESIAITVANVEKVAFYNAERYSATHNASEFDRLA